MQNNDQKAPRVSIGIPTYKRPEMLRRALLSIALQDFNEIEVIVGDNDCNSDASERVVRDFLAHIPNLTYRRHIENIGSTANFMYCLAAAKGEYFMWLADDDELQGAGYIRALVNVLDNNVDAVTAFARWKCMLTAKSGKLQPGRDYQSKNWLLRALKFAWRSDDDFFYGLHRTKLLRQARMKKYWAINSNTASDLTFVYIIDLVIAGRIIQLERADLLWVNHSYTTKDHTPTRTGRSVNLKFILKRLNVHWLYILAVLDRGGLFAAAALFSVSLGSLGVEACRIIFIFMRSRMNRILKSQP